MPGLHELCANEPAILHHWHNLVDIPDTAESIAASEQAFDKETSGIPSIATVPHVPMVTSPCQVVLDLGWQVVVVDHEEASSGQTAGRPNRDVSGDAEQVCKNMSKEDEEHVSKSKLISPWHSIQMSDSV